MAKIVLPQNSTAITPADMLMSAGKVRAFFGISDVTLWRWIRDTALNFPQPITIRSVRYWRASEIEAFVEAQQQTQAK